MRIACIHIPQYALQCATRVDPSLRGPTQRDGVGAPGAAIAMVDNTAPSFGGAAGRERVSAGANTAPSFGGAAGRERVSAGAGGTLAPASAFRALHAPVVVACSRAAWALGVRLGMTATAARLVSPEVAIVAVDPASERETVRAIGDAVLGLTPVVDVGGRVGVGGAHLAMYAEVPQKTRGQTFGERVLERLAQLGLTGRVGIADDRFTAWVAAAYGADTRTEPRARTEDHGIVTMVPRGGSAAFLAPRPLSLLAISAEVQHMLEALGVRTLGEFAALPAPSVARPLEADYRALARGESGTYLRPYAPEAAIREELMVAAGSVLDAVDGISGPTAIAQVARRVALRLEGRGRAAARLELAAVTATGTLTLEPDLALLAVGTAAAAARAELPGHIEPRTTPALAGSEDLARAIAPVLEAVAQAPTAWRLRVTVIGEAVTTLDEHDLAITTELAMPVRTHEPIAGRAASGTAAGASVHPGSLQPKPAALPRTASELREGQHGGASRPANANGIAPDGTAEVAPAIRAVANSNQHGAGALGASGDTAAADPLALVLSTSGSLFALAAPGAAWGTGDDRAERAHRRTRRGKQRRSRSMVAPMQARLFDRR